MIENGEYIGTSKNNKGKDHYIHHYLKTTINNEDSFITIREDLYKKENVFYTITDKTKDS